MILKILMCRCHLQNFFEDKEELVQMSRNFFCCCKENHRYFVLACKNHPFIKMSNRKQRCVSKVWRSPCNFCENAGLIFNNNAVKICSNKIPKHFTRAIPLRDYLRVGFYLVNVLLILKTRKFIVSSCKFT